jgi:hypothetical protein
MGTAAGLARSVMYVGAIVSAGLIALTFRPHATDAVLHHLTWVFVGLAGALLLVTLLGLRTGWHGDHHAEPGISENAA